MARLSIVNQGMLDDALLENGRDRGTGTALPAADNRRGDVYFHTGQDCLFVYNGTAWRQAQIPVSSSATAPLYDGQLRVHPTLGLQQSAGGAWKPTAADYDSGDVLPTLNAGFTNGAEQVTLRRRGWTVSIRGLVIRDSNTRTGPMFTMPAQFIPTATQWMIATASGATVCQMTATQGTGVVSVDAGPAGASAAFLFSSSWVTANPAA